MSTIDEEDKALRIRFENNPGIDIPWRRGFNPPSDALADVRVMVYEYLLGNSNLGIIYRNRGCNSFHFVFLERPAMVSS